MSEIELKNASGGGHGREEHEPRTPGTVALVLLLMAAFVVYYFANWKALADVWHVR